MGFFAKMIFFVQLAYEETKILWLFKVGDFIQRDRAKMIQLAYECTEDKDDVDNHEHFNCSETICLKCFGYTKNCEQQQQQTFGILLVMLLKILTRTRKTVTRIVILPGTLSGGTRKLGKGNDQHFWKKKEAGKRFNQLRWNPFSPQVSRRKLERIRSTSETIFHLIQDTMTNMPAGK